MSPNQYNIVRLALDRALTVFQESTSELSNDDREFLRQLELVRSYALKAESGHPFLFRQTPAKLASRESTAANVSSDNAISSEWPTKKSKRITVVIADDQDTVRDLLQAVLAAEGDFEVVAEATNGREAIIQVERHRPDLVIMDLNMPMLDGISATREALQASPASKILMFSASRDSANVQMALGAGAIGFVFKPAPRRALVEALRSVYRGEVVVPEGISVVAPQR